MKLIRDGEKGGRGRLYTYRYTVTTRMTPALRWAAMIPILMLQQEVMEEGGLRKKIKGLRGVGGGEGEDKGFKGRGVDGEDKGVKGGGR